MGALAVCHIEIVPEQWQLDYLGVVVGDTVRIRCEVEPMVPHGSPYANDALSGDPALRLAFKIDGKDGKAVYGHRDGDRTVMRAKSLVDELESVRDEESRAKARRFVPASQRLASRC